MSQVALRTLLLTNSRVALSTDRSRAIFSYRRESRSDGSRPSQCAATYASLCSSYSTVTSGMIGGTSRSTRVRPGLRFSFRMRPIARWMRSIDISVFWAIFGRRFCSRSSKCSLMSRRTSGQPRS